MKFRKYLLKEEFGLKGLDIAPLIDIVFILIIFFMLTSSFMVQPGIKVELPQTVTQSILQPERLNIIISSEDVAYLNGRVVTNRELEDFLNKNKAKVKSVFIKADRNSSLGRVVEIWDICRKVGLSYVNIATTYVRE
ncbi:MAG: biopolymer transporter ExbD [Candidatus Omnitrophica bacterium]|nr:biopolymer transporter ExbD [Candidatus Omnitrophota bacterium]